jgi:leader peptidase (prepilin peptidase)/N-methyltransferase
VFFLGLIIGSFLNVIIYRIPRKVSPAKGGSKCPECEHPIRWYDNIPLGSYMILRGKCRDCGAPISARYPVVELLTACLFLAVFLKEIGNNPDILTMTGLLSLIAYLYLAAVLIAISFIDADFHIIPDKITFPSFFIGLVLLLAADLSGWLNMLSGVAIGGGFLLILFLIAPVLLKKQGMGFGDVKLGAVLGVFLGWHVFLAIFLASIVGTVFGVAMIAAKKLKWQQRFAFGPCLAAGALLAYFFGTPLISWYVGLFSF